MQTKRAKVKQEMILLTLLHYKGEDVCCSLPRVQIREKRNTFSTLVKRVDYEAKVFFEVEFFSVFAISRDILSMLSQSKLFEKS